MDGISLGLTLEQENGAQRLYAVMPRSPVLSSVATSPLTDQ